MPNEKKIYEIKDGVNISADVVAIVAGLSATETEGVNSLAGGITYDEVSKAGPTKLSRAIRIIENEDESLSVRIHLKVDYGYEIPTVSVNVQQKVKAAIENMTGMKVHEVDIRIVSVNVPSGN